jgi:hypothetical protein
MSAPGSVQHARNKLVASIYRPASNGKPCSVAIRDDIDAVIAAAKAEASLPCHVCGKPATCIGRYEGHGDYAPACSACCGHGNEDGRCWPILDAIKQLSAMAISAEERA